MGTRRQGLRTPERDRGREARSRGGQDPCTGIRDREAQQTGRRQG